MNKIFRKPAERTIQEIRDAVAARLKQPERKIQTSISLSKSLLAWARDQAAAEGRTLSNWLDQLIRNKRGGV